MEARKFRESTVEGVTGACDEPAKMENLGDIAVGKKRLEVGRVVVRTAELDHMGIAIAIRQLHHAQGIAPQAKAHGFGVYGDRFGTRKDAVRQIARMDMIGQGRTAPVPGLF